ncbi:MULTISPECIES: branched-chain amino acid ABC transporter permease [Bosea]|mgnify:CR=1 FL=1|jgi:branched-chain amino acid transport system permease protein|uniref:Branched-chain amino acid ABC transporter permease n=3 Tax=Hyphomicrobiales TaxID=356 RepID=A0ABW0IWC5_9HYPH|nr:branched-chain amino acid ABC transporter permease [Bosea sp. (in: a-proteobacteria)]TAJ31483.1 MAG: branched-chain amino acid ABC transporter permease [Bosea sp. (in: a-proteobacteria)]
MQTAIQLTLTSLQIGAVYILFSLGLTLIFGVMRIVNFAHGHLFAVSALAVAWAVPWLAGNGLPILPAYLLAAVGGIAIAMALGLLMYVTGFRFFQRDMVGSFILSIGLVLLLDGVLLKVFGGAVRPVPEIFPGNISIFGAAITNQRFALCIAAILITASLYWALTRTKLGKALRAVSIDHEAAMLQGVPYNRMALAGFMIASGLAALAGALIAPVTIVSPVIGADYLIKGFIAVIVGGLGSVPGAILGGLFVAGIETFGSFYFDPSSATVAIFLLVIAVLLVRPKGLLGHG